MHIEGKELKIVVVLLFAITFVFIGWAVPSMWASHAPPSYFIDVNDFDAQNTSISAERHHICFDRDVRQGTTGKVYTELYRVLGDDIQVEVSTEVTTRYFQSGHHGVITTIELPPSVEPGKYRYRMVIRLDLVNERIGRDFVYHSNNFTIYESEDMVENEPIC